MAPSSSYGIVISVWQLKYAFDISSFLRMETELSLAMIAFPSGSVSYTHLDVYKRQQLYYTFIFYILSEKIDENFVIKSIEVL